MISSPGWAGRQWRTIARSEACASSSAFSWKGARSARRRCASVLVAHADPDVGVDRVGAGRRLARVARVQRRQPGLDPVAVRGGDPDLDARRPAEHGQRARDVVAVAHIGDPQAVQVAEALAERQQIGQRLAGMVVARQPVDHRHLRPVGQLRDHLVRARPDHDRLHVAGQNARRVPHRLAARELELVAAQDQRRAAELGHPDLERDARPRARACSKTSATLLPASRSAPSPLDRPAFSSSARSSSALSSSEAQLLAGQEVARHRSEHGTRLSRTYLGRGDRRRSPGTCSTAATSRPTRRSSPGARAWRRATERNATHVQVNRELFREFSQALCAARWDVALLQECPPRWSAPLAAACKASAHRSLTSRNWLRPRSRHPRPLEPRPARLLGGRLEPHPVQGRMRTACSTGETSSFAAVPSDAPWPSPGSTRASASPICTRARAPGWRRRRCATPPRRPSPGPATRPLILGGDFNLRPSQTPLFEELARRLGLGAPTGPDSIDHILGRGLEIVDPSACLASRGAGAALRGAPIAPLRPRPGGSRGFARGRNV